MEILICQFNEYYNVKYNKLEKEYVLKFDGSGLYGYNSLMVRKYISDFPNNKFEIYITDITYNEENYKLTGNITSNLKPSILNKIINFIKFRLDLGIRDYNYIDDMINVDIQSLNWDFIIFNKEELRAKKISNIIKKIKLNE